MLSLGEVQEISNNNDIEQWNTFLNKGGKIKETNGCLLIPEIAVDGGHKEIILSLFELSPSQCNIILQNICKKGDVELTDWFIDHMKTKNLFKKSFKEYLPNKNADDGLSGACEGGHLTIAKKMIDLGVNNFGSAFCCACRGGHLDMVKFILSNYEVDPKHFGFGEREANYHKRQDVMEYLKNSEYDRIPYGDWWIKN
tara:strand:- start:5101 stop:5694 length:594 start_codon:yes stop_codon:yes gene_type:complete